MRQGSESSKKGYSPERWGWDGEAPEHLPRSGMTQDEVAAALQISRTRVWQLERSAMKKLRRNPEARALFECLLRSDRQEVRV